MIACVHSFDWLCLSFRASKVACTKYLAVLVPGTKALKHNGLAVEDDHAVGSSGRVRYAQGKGTVHIGLF
jgi:hypothetical protein